MSRIAVIDFETTGLSPGTGGRATEVAIVLMEGGQVVDRFASLMNAGVYVPPFIESLTGISNAMVASAPPAHVVMADAARFVDGAPMVAHNAAFDKKFWQAELALADVPAPHPYACTVLLSRRLYPEAYSFKLGSLAAFHHLPSAGRAHRALADAEVAAALLARIQRDLERRWGVMDPHHGVLMAVQACPRHGLAALMKRKAEAAQA